MADPKPVYDFSDLQNWSTATRDLSPPARLAVIGQPVAHSASPQMHNPALREAGVDAQYVRIELQGSELAEALPLFRDAGFIGINVTIPHKGDLVDLVDYIDPLAKRIGSVNTVVFQDDGQILGFNSDAPGFRQAIREEFFVDLHDLRILLLGAGGGAGRAAAIQCAEDKCDRLVLVNRTPEKARALAEELQSDFDEDTHFAGPQARLQVVPWEDAPLAGALEHIDLIVNCTNVGMRLTDPELLTAHQLQPHHLVYDMIYSPPQTRLMRTAAAEGARVANGLGMLLWQGAISFEYWFNRKPGIDAMRAGLKAAIH